MLKAIALLTPILVLCLQIRGGNAAEPLKFTHAEFKYSVPAPPGWELYPSAELPKELAALFFQVGPDGEPTGASLSVRVFEDQVHSDLDFAEFIGLHQLNIRSLGVESEQLTRREFGQGYKQRMSLEYSLEEDESMVWYKQFFYRVSTDDVLMLSAKNLFDSRERTISEFNAFFDSVEVVVPDLVVPTPEPLDLPTPVGSGNP